MPQIVKQALASEIHRLYKQQATWLLNSIKLTGSQINNMRISLSLESFISRSSQSVKVASSLQRLVSDSHYDINHHTLINGWTSFPQRLMAHQSQLNGLQMDHSRGGRVWARDLEWGGESWREQARAVCLSHNQATYFATPDSWRIFIGIPRTSSLLGLPLYTGPSLKGPKSCKT